MPTVRNRVPQPDGSEADAGRPGDAPPARDLGADKRTRLEGTLTDRAYGLIRSDILNGHMKAGQPLRLEALKDRYGLSFSPLREALNRLHSERLVSLSALRGFRVADVSREEMWDTINTRILIETQALERSIAFGDDDWEGTILSAFHSLAVCAKRLSVAEAANSNDELEELERRHRKFHFSLIAACRSAWLLEFSSRLYAQTERYRRPHLSVGQGTWAFRDIAREHEMIMDSALARDTPRSVRLLTEHYQRTGTFIEKHENSSGPL